MIVVVTLMIAAANAAEPLVLKYIFDGLAGEGVLSVLFVGIGGLLGLGLLRELGNALSNWLTWQTRLSLHYSLLESTVGRLHLLPMGIQAREGVGGIMTRLDRGIQGFIEAVTQILFHIFPGLVFLAISTVVMVQLEWRLALLVLAFAPVPALIARLAVPEQIQRERSLLDQWARIYSRFNEVLSGIVTVRSFAMEEMEKRRFLDAVVRANGLVVRGVARDSGFGAATNLVVMLARIAAIALGGYLVFRREITVGTLVAFLSYIGGLFGPVQGLSGIYQTVRKATVSLDEVFKILDVREQVEDVPNAKEVKALRGNVELRNVRFAYEPGGRRILDGFSLTVPAGQTVALVGPSGAGKSTVLALLMRFYDPQEGAVYLDGEDIRALTKHSLRRSIGVVLQDPLLFNDTIRNNIAYGRPQATMAEIEAAARAAHAHDFIMQLPEGYETMAGERGSSRLSLGERQRITIARAIVKDPPLVILDEATSALDAEAEAMVQEALRHLTKDRTTFVIAHRLSTVVHADRIIVLREGKIEESGTHGQLMRAGGYYASLVHRQTCGLIRNEGEEPAEGADLQNQSCSRPLS